MNKEKALKNQGLEFREDIAFTGGAQTVTDTVDDTACVPSVYIRYICHISLSSISPVPTLYPLVA